jgi:AbiV family abortive infection protein
MRGLLFLQWIPRMLVSAECLLHGAGYALEQCGILLRDANILFKNGSYASAVVLAAFAREELGRYHLLIDLRRRTLGGESFTVKEVHNHCKNHELRQQAGMLGVAARENDIPAFRQLLQLVTNNEPQSEESKKAMIELDRMVDERRKQIPSERHELRMRTLYVWLTENDWNRPNTTSQAEAYRFIQDAVNDYKLRYHQGYVGSLDQEVANAFKAWAGRPKLPTPDDPVWPE